MPNPELFSTQAASYAKYRPTYPQELYEFIFSHVQHRETAWDCGTGNGQAAAVLAGYFQKVIGSDISTKQLDFAIKKPNIEYVNCSAEQTPFADNSFDLITVAQAYHWFDFSAFKKEVTRVGRPGSLLAIWTYGHVQVNEEIDQIMRHFHDVVVGRYWDERRKYVVEGLINIPFDYPEIHTPSFQIFAEWKRSDIAGYLDSWSAVQTFIRATGKNPVPELIENLKEYWNNDVVKSVKFPLTLRLGKVKI
jgi:ubiquinone/menaquinone biosynthesis C-methylase UbiE